MSDWNELVEWAEDFVEDMLETGYDLDEIESALKLTIEERRDEE